MGKKVLIFVNADLVLYNFRRELVESLLDKGFEVIAVSPNGPRIQYFIDLGCKFIEVPVERHGKNPLKDIKLYIRYKRIISDIQPDVILTYTIKPNIYGALAAKKYKVPCIANITGLGTALESRGILQKILITMYKFSFSKINTVFFQNKSNQEFFENHKLLNGNSKLIPGSGVNLQQFELQPYPDDSEKNKFVFISRVMKEKGIDTYLLAAEKIKQVYPAAEFHVCGFLEDDYSEKLHDFEERGIIKYHGMISNIADFLKGIHCTIHPSYYPEGISNVLLESAASGKPIITTHNPGCEEVIEGDGINGYLFDAKNVDQLVNKIQTFIKLSFSEKDLMGQRGRKFVEENFDRKIVVKQYLDEIGKITK